VIKQMKEKDMFGMVSYDSLVREDVPLSNLTSANVVQAQKAIQSLVAGSCTNLSGGLFKGLDQLAIAAAKPSEGNATVDAIWLFTDGLANEGIRDGSKLREAVQKIVSQMKSRVQVHCFGFGEDHNADFLRAIAEATGGMYYFIDKEEDIPTSFAQCLGGLLSVFAQNIEVVAQIEGDGQITKSHSSRPATISSDGKQFSFNLADIYGGEARDILLSLSVKATAVPVEIKVNVRYMNVVSIAMETISQSTTITRPQKEPDVIPPEPELLVLQKARLRTTEALEAARKHAEKGQFEEAQKAVRFASETLVAGPYSDGNYSLGLQQDLLLAMDGVSGSAVYRTVGSKRIAQAHMEHQSQRSASDWGCRKTPYSNTFQECMKRRV